MKLEKFRKLNEEEFEAITEKFEEAITALYMKCYLKH